MRDKPLLCREIEEVFKVVYTIPLVSPLAQEDLLLSVSVITCHHLEKDWHRDNT